MTILMRIIQRQFAVCAALTVVATPAAAQSFSGPYGPSVTTGDYTVSISPNCDPPVCNGGISEKPEGGSYSYIGEGSVSFTSKPDGIYSYMASYYVCYPGPYGTPICEQEQSGPLTVRVVDGMPTRDSIQTQLDYDYEARTGDINGDGDTDIFVQKTSGGEPYNGVVEELILEQTSSGAFQASVPSATQTSTASNWPLAGLEIVLEDFNVDGFADVLLKGVAAAVGSGGTPNQIVYAPGQPLNATPLGVRAVDGSLTEFVENSLDYFVNPDYYVENVPVVVYSTTIWYASCGYSYPGIDPIYQGNFLNCNFSYVTLSGAYPDWSAFSDPALSIWANESAIEVGDSSTEEGVDAIVNATEMVLDVSVGGWPVEEELGQTGDHTDPDARRGLEVFWAILGIGRANAQEVETEEAPSQAPRVSDVIYVTSRHIVGEMERSNHTNLEYTSLVPTWIGGYDTEDSFNVNGKLEARTNNAADAPRLTMTFGKVQPVLGKTEAEVWFNQILPAHNSYRNRPELELLNYHWNPSFALGENYNCNGYSHGLIEFVDGREVRIMPSGGLGEGAFFNILVGWEEPVPNSAFN